MNKYVPSVVSQLRPPMNIFLVIMRFDVDADCMGRWADDTGYGRARTDISIGSLEQRSTTRVEKRTTLLCVTV